MGAVKNFFLNFNAFETRHFFRFNKDHKYTNVLGGVFTFLLVIFILVLLIIKIISVFQTPTVYVEQTTHFEFDQSIVTPLSPQDQENPFLVAYQIVKTTSSLNKSQFKKNLVVYVTNFTHSYIPLEECNPEHWKQAPNQYQQVLNSVATDSYIYCLPMNFSHPLTIAQEAAFTINIGYYCQAECSTINVTQMFVRPIILNKFLDPQKRDEYLKIYLLKRLYYSMSSASASIDRALQYQFSRYLFNTDSSILPIQKISRQQGFFIPQHPVESSRVNSFTQYVFFRTLFMMNNQEQHYFRRFSKLLDAISQIGGLIPIILFLFIWLNYYALYQFQMVFLRRMHNDFQTKEYGLRSFILNLIYTAFSAFGITFDSWQKTKSFNQKHNKVNQFLDILYLHKRLQFIERALSVIFEDHQLQALHLMRNKTFNQATDHLHRYQMKENLSNFIVTSRLNEALRMSHINSRPQIELKPFNGVDHAPSSDIHKNLVVCKQFEGEAQQNWRAPSATVLTENNPQPDDPNLKEQNLRKLYKLHMEGISATDEETVREQMEDLKYAFTSFERIRQEASNSQSEHYNQISRNIIKNLNQQDWQLLSNLKHFLDGKEKEQIMANIQDFFCNQNFKQEDELFNKPIEQLRQSCNGGGLMRSTKLMSPQLRRRVSKPSDEPNQRNSIKEEILVSKNIRTKNRESL